METIISIKNKKESDEIKIEDIDNCIPYLIFDKERGRHEIIIRVGDSILFLKNETYETLVECLKDNWFYDNYNIIKNIDDDVSILYHEE